MALMDKMMDRMIKNMTVREKEEIMLKMMPVMMKGIDIKKMAPEMMTAMGRLITVTGIVSFLVKVMNDEQIKELFGELKTQLSGLMGKMQTMMSHMKPAMSVLMSGMMEFMGHKVMPVMMPMMHEMMPLMMKEKMPEIMQKNETIKEMMPRMMMEVIPECLETMLPMIEQKKRDEFISDMVSATKKGAIGQMSEKDKKELEKINHQNN